MARRRRRKRRRQRVTPEQWVTRLSVLLLTLDGILLITLLQQAR